MSPEILCQAIIPEGCALAEGFKLKDGQVCRNGSFYKQIPDTKCIRYQHCAAVVCAPHDGIKETLDQTREQ